MADDDEYDFSGVSDSADALLSQWRAQNQEDEDDDDTSYFWPDQPPYDIEEKLREINQVHQQDETPVESDRPRAVTFNNRVQMRAISMRKLAPAHEENDDEPFDLSKYETGETVTDVETSIGARSSSAPQQRATPPQSTTPPPYSATARSASPVGRNLPTAPRTIGRRHPTRPGFNDAQNSLLDWADAALHQAAPAGGLPEDCLSLLSLTDDDAEPEPARRQLTTPAPPPEPTSGPEPIDDALSPLISSMPNLVVSCVTQHQGTTEQCMDISTQVQRQTAAGQEAVCGGSGGRTSGSRGGSADSGHLSDAADSSGGSGGRAGESRGGSADSGHLSDAADSSETSSSARSDDSAVESMDERATSGDSAGSEPPVPLPRQARQRRRPPARPASPLKAGPPPRPSSPLKAGGGAAASPERMLRRPRSAPCRVTPAAAAGRPDCAARGGARQRTAVVEKVAPPAPAARRLKKRSGGADPSLSFQEWLIQHERERARAVEERKHSAKKRKQEAAIKKEQSPLAFRAWLRKKQQQRCVEQRLQQLHQRELLASAVQQRAAAAQPDAFRHWLQRKQRERAASAPVRPRTTLRCLASLYSTHPGAPAAQAAGPHHQLEVIYRPQLKSRIMATR